MDLNPRDRRKLAATLQELGRAVEDLLLTGLTTASEATRQTLSVAFQEASRLGLLRLGSTLRVANEELGRFTSNDADFSRSRFAFFLNRTWLLAKGLLRALDRGDDAAFDKLMWTPPSQPVAKVEVVALGVAKKVAARSFVAFDFRLRLVRPAGPLAAGQRISWSCVFPVKPTQEIPAEAFLHLPQKQKFTAFQFLEGKTMVLEKVAVSVDDAGLARLSLGPQSTVVQGEEFEDYEQYSGWDPARALERIRQHEPGPFDLEVEMQEEIVLGDWTLGAPVARESEKQYWYPLTHGQTEMVAAVSQGDDGTQQKKQLDDLSKKKQRPPLFGLLHYEKCRLIVQPLTVFGKEGPEHLMLSPDKVDRATLLKALKF
jgi:hypothetical protein